VRPVDLRSSRQSLTTAIFGITNCLVEYDGPIAAILIYGQEATVVELVIERDFLAKAFDR
jgi:hypothetical protein